MRKRVKSITGIMLAVAMMGTLLTGCGNAASGEGGGESGATEVETALSVETKLTNTKLEGEKDDSKKTVTTLLEFTPEPAGHGHPYVEGGPNWSLQPLIYETLCDYSSQPETTFKPQLLESYTWEDQVLTMKLKEGLKYSDGSEINADELLNNMYMDLSNQQLLIYAASIEKLDDLTVQVTYTKNSSL